MLGCGVQEQLNQVEVHLNDVIDEMLEQNADALPYGMTPLI